MATNIAREWSYSGKPEDYFSEEYKSSGQPKDSVDFGLSQFGKCEIDGGDDQFILWYNEIAGTRFSTDVAWCSIFVSWCMKENEKLKFANAEDWLKYYKKNGQFFKGKPKRGDVFFVTNNSSRQNMRMSSCDNTIYHPTHVGLVVDINEDENYFTSIEGNYSDSVKMINRYFDNPNLLGFGKN